MEFILIQYKKEKIKVNILKCYENKSS